MEVNVSNQVRGTGAAGIMLLKGLDRATRRGRKYKQATAGSEIFRAAASEALKEAAYCWRRDDPALINKSMEKVEYFLQRIARDDFQRMRSWACGVCRVILADGPERLKQARLARPIVESEPSDPEDGAEEADAEQQADADVEEEAAESEIDFTGVSESQRVVLSWRRTSNHTHLKQGKRWYRSPYSCQRAEAKTFEEVAQDEGERLVRSLPTRETPE